MNELRAEDVLAQLTDCDEVGVEDIARVLARIGVESRDEHGAG